MSQSLWDILGERIGDMNPTLLTALVTGFSNPEDRIDALLRYADDGFCTVGKGECRKLENYKKLEVMPSCRKNLNRQKNSRKNLHGRKSNTFKQDIEFILCKYSFA